MFIVVASCIVLALLATLAARRWVWPHGKPTAIVLREGQPDGKR